MSRLAAIPERWRALGGAMLALLIAYLALVHWWFTAPMLAMGEQIHALGEEETALRLEAGQRAQITRQLAQVREFETANPGFLPEANRELASAGLVQRLEQVVGSASADNKSCQITARTPAEMPSKEPFARVAVQVRLRCGTDELAAVLHSLESGSPQLFIDNLDLLSRRSYLMNNVESAGILDVSFDLYGYLKATPGGRRD